VHEVEAAVRTTEAVHLLDRPPLLSVRVRALLQLLPSVRTLGTTDTAPEAWERSSKGRTASSAPFVEEASIGIGCCRASCAPCYLRMAAPHDARWAEKQRLGDCPPMPKRGSDITVRQLRRGTGSDRERRTAKLRPRATAGGSPRRRLPSPASGEAGKRLARAGEFIRRSPI